MMEHTKEHWYVGAQNDGLFIVAGRPPALNNDYPVHNADRTLIAVMKGDNSKMDSANARRIVACVNACAGIPTDLLEAGNGVADAVRHFQAQRDELLAALKAMVGNTEADSDESEAAHRQARAAIVNASK